MEKTTGNDILARIVGMLVFLSGVGILIFVFARSYSLFTAPVHGVNLAQNAPSLPPTSANLSGAALTLLVQIGLLFIMTLVGSLIAARGVQLYLGCEKKQS